MGSGASTRKKEKVLKKVLRSKKKSGNNDESENGNGDDENRLSVVIQRAQKKKKRDMIELMQIHKQNVVARVIDDVAELAICNAQCQTLNIGRLVHSPQFSSVLLGGILGNMFPLVPPKERARQLFFLLSQESMITPESLGEKTSTELRQSFREIAGSPNHGNAINEDDFVSYMDKFAPPDWTIIDLEAPPTSSSSLIQSCDDNAATVFLRRYGGVIPTNSSDMIDFVNSCGPPSILRFHDIYMLLIRLLAVLAVSDVGKEIRSIAASDIAPILGFNEQDYLVMCKDAWYAASWTMTVGIGIIQSVHDSTVNMAEMDSVVWTDNERLPLDIFNTIVCDPS